MQIFLHHFLVLFSCFPLCVLLFVPLMSCPSSLKKEKIFSCQKEMTTIMKCCLLLTSAAVLIEQNRSSQSCCTCDVFFFTRLFRVVVCFILSGTKLRNKTWKNKAKQKKIPRESSVLLSSQRQIGQRSPRTSPAWRSRKSFPGRRWSSSPPPSTARGTRRDHRPAPTLWPTLCTWPSCREYSGCLRPGGDCVCTQTGRSFRN